MTYPEKPTGDYELRDDVYGVDDNSITPMTDDQYYTGFANASEDDDTCVPDAHNENWIYRYFDENMRYAIGTADENKDLLESKVATLSTIGQVKVGEGLNINSSGLLSAVATTGEDTVFISYDIPVGTLMWYAGNTIPSYFISPTGQELSRATYSELWTFAQENDQVGEGLMFGEGDGSTTFTVSDLQGMFLRSVDEVGDVDSTEISATITKSSATITDLSEEDFNKLYEGMEVYDSTYFAEGTTISNINSDSLTAVLSTVATASGTNMTFKGRAIGTMQDDEYEAHTHSFYAVQKGGSFNDYDDGSGNPVSPSTSSTYSSGGVETRPKNIALRLILKAINTPSDKLIPTGMIMQTLQSTAPTGFIKLNGAEVNRDTYSDLHAFAVSQALIGDDLPFGVGDGSTTFTVPDYRSEFFRAWDDGRGIDENRVLGSYQADEYKAHTHTVSTYSGASGADAGGSSFLTSTRTRTTSSSGGDETRPRNIALMYCIKY